MKRAAIFLVATILLASLAGLALAQGSGQAPSQAENTSVAPMGTAFTYQGVLRYKGSPVSGTYDFRFRLYDAQTGGSQIGSDVTVEDVVVSNGLFSASLDFGEEGFSGRTARFLEIGVRPGSSTGPYTELLPRQRISPSPYALALPGMWTQERSSSPKVNVIGGDPENRVIQGAFGATIGGGGDFSHPNRVSDHYGTVGGGEGNVAGSIDLAMDPTNSEGATVGGGLDNVASGAHATVSGGNHNTASGAGSAVAGGGYNTASGSDSMVGGNHNTASGDKAFIGGGFYNVADGQEGAISGGRHNIAHGAYSSVGGGYYVDAEGQYSVIGGGISNQNDGTGATVGGGGHNAAVADFAVIAGGGGFSAQYGNRVTDEHGTICGGGANLAGNDAGSATDARYATVCGGSGNIAGNIYSTVAGGDGNQARGSSSTIAGGDANQATGGRSTVGGGGYNIASGEHSTVPGGFSNKAEGDFSFAAGRFARARYDGSFVWADSQVAQVSSPKADSFVVRARGGIWFGTNSSPSIPAGRLINTSTGAYLSTGGTWVNSSDRNLKERFSLVDPEEFLDALASIPISTWSYKAEPGVRHVGPTAQDFYAAFGLGQDDRHISTIDAEGVTMAALQGLYRRVQDQEEEIRLLRRENDELKIRLAALESLMAASTNDGK